MSGRAMVMSPKELSTKIIAGIHKKPDMSYSILEAHAKKLNIPIGIFQNAMTLVQSNKTVQAKIKKGELVYSPKAEVVPKAPGSHLLWLKNNYPSMTKENDGSGLEADYSYLFLSPEDLDKYKAESRGVSYIPKKRYERK